MSSKGFNVGLALVLALLCWATVTSAQETGSGETPESPAENGEPKGQKMPFALYVYTGYGAGSTDPFNTSIQTDSNHISENWLEVDDWIYGKAAVGWKLPNQKGDFLVAYNGYKENNYTFSARGLEAYLGVNGNIPYLIEPAIIDPVLWWQIDIADGQMDTWRHPPYWDDSLDANGNMLPDSDEVIPIDESPLNPGDHAEFPRIFGMITEFSQAAPETLQNQTMHIDFMYGREWGKRRYSARWWAGLRYYRYEGNLLAGAWMNVAQRGEGYTDGAFIPLLHFKQESSAYGPTGALEANFNFFEKRLVFYLQGQAAFMLSDVNLDSGPFFTLLSPGDQQIVPIQSHLIETRDKSVWQSMGEAGIRINLKGGLQFDFAYQINGYLDTIIVPKKILLPTAVTQQVSAIYSTQDIVLESWRAGIGFQF